MAVVPALGDPVVIYGTGMGPGGALTPGSVDSFYTLASPDIYAPGPATYVSSPLDAGWVANTANSQWISPSVDGRTGYGDFTYSYTTTFTLTSIDASSLVLTGELAADDSTTVFLNGAQVLGPAFGTFSTYSPFEISSGFISGVNTVTFDVLNSGSGATGLNVAISVATPEPNFQIAIGLMVLLVGLFAFRNRHLAANRSA